MSTGLYLQNLSKTANEYNFYDGQIESFLCSMRLKVKTSTMTAPVTTFDNSSMSRINTGKKKKILSLSEFCGYHWKKKMLISDFKVFKIQARNTLNINDSKLIDKLQTYKISYFVCHSAESTFQQKLIEVNTLPEDYFREIR